MSIQNNCVHTARFHGNYLVRAGILDEGNAYEDYATNETEKWDPWNLEDGELEQRGCGEKICKMGLFVSV